LNAERKNYRTGFTLTTFLVALLLTACGGSALSPSATSEGLNAADFVTGGGNVTLPGNGTPQPTALTVNASLLPQLTPGNTYAVYNRADNRVKQIDSYQAMTGIGAGSSGHNRRYAAGMVKKGNQTTVIFDYTRVSRYSVECPEGQGVVGFAPISDPEVQVQNLLCAPTLEGITLGDVKSVSVVWDYNQVATCPANMLLVGAQRRSNIYLDVDGRRLAAPNGIVTIKCAPALAKS
jgi:hypothetical protein